MGDFNATQIFDFIIKLQNTIETAVFSGVLNLTDPMLNLLAALGLISIATNWGLYFDGNFNFGNLITKIIHIGFVAFLIRNWLMFMKMIKESGEKLGMLASGHSDMPDNATLINNNIAKVYEQISVAFDSFSFTGDHVMALVISIFLLIICIYCFFRISYTAFTANAEFIIIGGLSIVLLPFGVTQWTKDIGNKPWGILLTCAVKVLVITFFMGLVTALIDQAFTLQSIGSGLSDDAARNAIRQNLPNLATTTISLLFLAFLIGQATEFAGAITNGAVISTGDRLLGTMSNTAGRAGGMVTDGIGWGIGKGRQTMYRNSSKYRKASDAWATLKNSKIDREAFK